jgi:hypothetical protein
MSNNVPCAVSAAELQHDRGAQKRYDGASFQMVDAIEDCVWRIFDGQSIGCPKIDLAGFLDGLEDSGGLKEIVSQALAGGDSLRDLLEARLRKDLEDSDTVLDRADELARDAEEEAS